MKCLSFLIAFSLVSAIELRAQGSNEIVSRDVFGPEFEAYVEAAMNDWHVPGLAISVVLEDEVVLARGFGIRKLGEDHPVTPRTLFGVASNTKAFTAALLATLVDEGRLEWSTRIRDVLPSFRLHDDYASKHIQVVDLLCHRSGLPTFGGDHLWIGQALTREEILRRLAFLKPGAPFRERFQYQNLMYLVAGMVAGEVAQTSYEQMFRDRILKPLGISRAVLANRELDPNEDFAWPHERFDGELRVVSPDQTYSIAPAGGLVASVLDMAQWMRLQLGEGTIDGKRLISKASMNMMHRIHLPMPANAFDREHLGTRFHGYGLGWGISEAFGYKIVTHGGGLSGMLSRQLLVPELRLGVMVVTNKAPGALARAITRRTLELMLGREAVDWSRLYAERSGRAEKAEQERWQSLQEKRRVSSPPTLKEAEYEGAYANGFSGQAKVSVQDDGSFLFDYNPRHRGRMSHWHGDVFRVDWEDPIFDMDRSSFVRFEVDEKGEVLALNVRFYHWNRFERVGKR